MSDDKSAQQSQEFLPEIRRARLGRLTIFEVSESELTLIEKGSPDSIYLNFAIALLTTAISLTVVLVTAALESTVLLLVFVVCTVLGYICGLLLLALWWRTRSSVSECIDAIRRRLTPEGVVEPLPNVPNDK